MDSAGPGIYCRTVEKEKCLIMDEFKDALKILAEIAEGLEEEGDIQFGSNIPELCTEMMCFGVPNDISRLINAGYGHVLRLARVTMIIGSKKGALTSEEIPMVQLQHDKDGCVMYKNGKCLLAESGLTPMMGKIHLLTGGAGASVINKLLFHQIIGEWGDRDNEAIVRFCLKSLDRINKSISRNHTN